MIFVVLFLMVLFGVILSGLMWLVENFERFLLGIITVVYAIAGAVAIVMICMMLGAPVFVDVIAIIIYIAFRYVALNMDERTVGVFHFFGGFVSTAMIYPFAHIIVAGVNANHYSDIFDFKNLMLASLMGGIIFLGISIASSKLRIIIYWDTLSPVSTIFYVFEVIFDTVLATFFFAAAVAVYKVAITLPQAIICFVSIIAICIIFTIVSEKVTDFIYVKKGYKTFDKKQELDNYKKNDRVVQIYDTIFVPGSTVKEVMALIKTSKVNFKYEYNPDSLVVGGGNETIDIFTEGSAEAVIRICAANYAKNILRLEEIPAIWIIPINHGINYAFFLGGKSYNDFAGMSYSRLREYCKNIFDVEPKESDTMYPGGYGVDVECICCDYDGKNVYLNVPSMSDCKIYENTHYCFYINKQTGRVFAFEIKPKDIYCITPD